MGDGAEHLTLLTRSEPVVQDVTAGYYPFIMYTCAQFVPAVYTCTQPIPAVYTCTQLHL